MSEEEGAVPAEDGSYGILLTVGFVPGMKVDAVPLLSTSAYVRNSCLEAALLIGFKGFSFFVQFCRIF